jgi:lysosomal Pro-X carboxypeptidase
MAALALPFPGFLVLLLFGLFSLMLSCCIPISHALSMRRPPRVPRFPYSAKQRGGVGGGDGGAEGIYLGVGGIKYDIQYYTQTLDHFDFRNESTFQQRYLIDARHWNGADKRGPIFLYCGNEGDIEWFAANSGFLWDIAPVFGALILFPEVSFDPSFSSSSSSSSSVSCSRLRCSCLAIFALCC